MAENSSQRYTELIAKIFVELGPLSKRAWLIGEGTCLLLSSAASEFDSRQCSAVKYGQSRK